MLVVKVPCSICGFLKDINAECAVTQVCRDYYDNWNKLDKIRRAIGIHRGFPHLGLVKIQEILDGTDNNLAG